MIDQLTLTVLALSRLHSDGASKLADQIGYQRASMSRAVARRTLPAAVQEALAQLLQIDAMGFNPIDAVDSWLLRESDDLEHLRASGVAIHPLLLLMPTKDAMTVKARLNAPHREALTNVPLSCLAPPPTSGQHVLLGTSMLGGTKRVVLMRSHPQLMLGALHQLGVEFILLGSLPPVLLKFVPQIKGGLSRCTSSDNEAARVLTEEINSLPQSHEIRNKHNSESTRKPDVSGHLRVLGHLSDWLENLKGQALEASKSGTQKKQSPLESSIANLYGLNPSQQKNGLWMKTLSKGQIRVELAKAIGSSVIIKRRRGDHPEISLVIRAHGLVGVQIFEILYAGPRLKSGVYSCNQIRDAARRLASYQVLQTAEEAGFAKR